MFREKMTGDAIAAAQAGGTVDKARSEWPGLWLRGNIESRK